MVKNPERRTHLLDAAVEVLAALGARGLTFRAVDTRAEVPTGTASNYFTSRADLLRQVGDHVFVRLAPPPGANEPEVPEDDTVGSVLMRAIVERAEADRAGYLALVELRLEAARDPRLNEAFTQRIRHNLDAIIGEYAGAGLPDDRFTPIMLYLAMNGLLLDHLTLPKVLAEEGDGDLVGKLVSVIVPREDSDEPD